ncbi:MAG: hypothetical protein H7A32_01000 [Deltaproteobacteria bacterium]|nr:hypothetical protein [Deltaproteobacteria bacterium]
MDVGKESNLSTYKKNKKSKIERPNRKHDDIVAHAIRHIDHVTYAGKVRNEADFIDRWNIMGFSELVRLHTQRYPATHIALTSGQNPNFPWETMTGLSISEDPGSPINEFVIRYGEGIQHVAYNIDPNIPMEEVYRELKRRKWQFMTNVLIHKDDHGARLCQLFTAPQVPAGTFVELVQRLPGKHGEIFDTFDIANIDDLYEAYAQYSAWLEKHHHSSALKYQKAFEAQIQADYQKQMNPSYYG